MVQPRAELAKVPSAPADGKPAEGVLSNRPSVYWAASGMTDSCCGQPCASGRGCCAGRGRPEVLGVPAKGGSDGRSADAAARALSWRGRRVESAGRRRAAYVQSAPAFRLRRRGGTPPRVRLATVLLAIGLPVERRLLAEPETPPCPGRRAASSMASSGASAACAASLPWVLRGSDRGAAGTSGLPGVGATAFRGMISASSGTLGRGSVARASLAAPPDRGPPGRQAEAVRLPDDGVLRYAEPAADLGGRVSFTPELAQSRDRIAVPVCPLDVRAHSGSPASLRVPKTPPRGRPAPRRARAPMGARPDPCAGWRRLAAELGRD